MYYRIKFILKDLLITPIQMFWKQIAISSAVSAVFTVIVKPDVNLFLAALGFCFLVSMMVSMANDNYERQREKTLDNLKK